MKYENKENKVEQDKGFRNKGIPMCPIQTSNKQSCKKKGSHVATNHAKEGTLTK